MELTSTMKLAAILVLTCGAGCDAFREPLEADALLGVWVVEGGGSARILRDDRTGTIPDLQYEEHLRDATGWQRVRAGTWGVRSQVYEAYEVAGVATIAELQANPGALEGFYVDVFGRDAVNDVVEGIVSLDGNVLVTITPYSDGPITHTRVESLPP